MPTDYEALHGGRDLEGELKRSVGLLADMYEDPSHFIIELLQNAEDALAKRPDGWLGERTICFNVLKSSVEVAHFGRPFNEDDVRGIVITLASTKQDDLNAIGKFGIGFKSVFNITERPEIHSGDEHFAIEDRIKPVAIEPIADYDPELTVFRLPLNENGKANKPDIVSRLADLEPRTLLFLRHIDGIIWQETAGRKGKLCRETEELDERVRKVRITCDDGNGQVESSEQWVVFSRPVARDDKPAGYVEIAFQLSGQHNECIQPLADSPLTVFFPTIVPTRLGFLIQGPYRTTPNRENVPATDEWNRKLMAETATLIQDALRWLKDNQLLDAQILDGFPIRGSYERHERYTVLYDATKAALQSHALLPCTDGFHHRVSKTRLGNTRAIRQLFSPAQLAQLYGESGLLFWIDGSITDDSFQELRRYIRDELGVADLTPESLIPLLRSGRAFLEAQTDEWIRQLYEFLGQQSALHNRLGDIPLLRLEDGPHVAPENELPAFLPGKFSSGANTIRKSVCNSEASLDFLKSLELRERDPVDDVIQNVLPKYQEDKLEIADYATDIGLMINAFTNVSASRKDELTGALCEVAFVRTVNAGDKSKRFATPEEVFLADDEGKSLFAGVPGVLFLDDAYGCVRSPEFCHLLGECGAMEAADQARVVTKHVLPKYANGTAKVSAVEYPLDIKRILATYEATPIQRRPELRNRLQATPFVRAIDTGKAVKLWRRPESLYLATEALRELFSQVPGVLMVDPKQNCLRGERITNLLEGCGASRNLRMASFDPKFTWQEKERMRAEGGFADSSGGEKIDDHTIVGLDALLRTLPEIDVQNRAKKAKLLWQSVCELEDKKGSAVFSGTYKWTYHRWRSTRFDAAFVRKLNDRTWVPDADGELRRPALVLFDTLAWQPNDFVETKIRFQPPIVQELARQAGIEEGVIELVAREGITVDELQEFREWKHGQDTQEAEPNPASLLGSMTGTESTRNHNQVLNHGTGATQDPSPSPQHTPELRQPNSGTRAFVSYIQVQRESEEAEADPDGLEHTARMALEEKAIAYILSCEPDWKRTPTHNPGFDLYQVDDDDVECTWCELKAMSGTFENRPATMTRRQFEEAQQRGVAYWLYVVENADSDSPRIVKIQDPAGQARTFTFDKGWRDATDSYE